MPKRILFIDDEQFFATKYIEHLERLFEVTYCETVLEAFEILSRQDTRYDGVVLDVMMPSPKGMEGPTANGLDTGLWFLDKCRAELGTWPIPVMVLTNRNPKDIRDAVSARKFNPQKVDVRHKLETPAFAFPDILGKFLGM
ncbi:MAG: hypothetical protein FLDDKLPJ_00466 [Phycisphaerae bacterium]|nr:hypothetical protein [Phycisphaerae bacterium]